MYDLTIFVPTRGRPKKLLDFWGEFERTKTANSRVVFVIDGDDPERAAYVARCPEGATMLIAPDTKRGMVGALNWAFGAMFGAAGGFGFASGFMGDDHRPRTMGWDQAYLDALHGLHTGFVYGDDLFQGERIPTQIAMTTDIPKTLGWMCPPQFEHLFVDNVWLDLGKGIDRIKYLPEVVIEHMHPIAGKARSDRTYRIVNSPYIARRDQESYLLWKQDELPRNLEDLRKLL